MKKFFFLFLILILLTVAFSFLDITPCYWTQDLADVPVCNACLLIHPTNAQIMYAGSGGSGVYLSIDGGVTWIPTNSGLNTHITAIALAQSNPNILYAGTLTAGMYKSTNAGTNWVQINSGLTEYVIYGVQAIVVKSNDPNTVVCCLFNGTSDATTGVYKTTNGGVSWTGSTTGLINSMHNFLCLISNPGSPNTIYMGSSFYVNQTGPCYIYKSYDFGSTWINSSNGLGIQQTSTDIVSSLSFSTIDTNTFLAGLYFNTTNGGPYLTTNAGALWVQKAGGIPVTTTPGPIISAVKIKPSSNSVFFLGGNSAASSLPPGGVCRSTNAGLNWLEINGQSMVQNNAVRAFNYRLGDLILFAGVSSNTPGVFEYNCLGAVSGNNNNTPTEFSLNQNYPNPFNPVTVINYQLPKYSIVKLSVYDILGREVEVLVNEYQAAGSYDVKFDGTKLTSGVYFYTLKTEKFTDTKRMLLIK